MVTLTFKLGKASEKSIKSKADLANFDSSTIESNIRANNIHLANLKIKLTTPPASFVRSFASYINNLTSVILIFRYATSCLIMANITS